jgi:dihydropteroate synthase
VVPRIRVLQVTGRAAAEHALLQPGHVLHTSGRGAATPSSSTAEPSPDPAFLEPVTLRFDGLTRFYAERLGHHLRDLGIDPLPGSVPSADGLAPPLFTTSTRARLDRAARRLQAEIDPALAAVGGELLRALEAREQPLAAMTLGRSTWDFSRPVVAGIINVTPDSFSDGGRFMAHDAAIGHGVGMVAAGAELLDIGGESTRAGANPVAAADEQERILPVVRALCSKVTVPLSIDTYHAATARAAVAAGCSIINDVSGLQLDPAMAETVAATRAVVILGHLRGTPQAMMERVRFADVVGEVIDELGARVEQALRAGVARNRIIVDPGLGFGKLPAHSMELVMRAGEIREALGCPVMLGPSRKSFVGAATGAPVEDRLAGTLAAVTASVLAGANLLRVHDVAPALQAVRMACALLGARRGA